MRSSAEARVTVSASEGVRERRMARFEVVRNSQDRASHLVRARAADAHDPDPRRDGRGGKSHDRVGGGEHRLQPTPAIAPGQKQEARIQKQEERPVQLNSPSCFWLLTIASGPFWLLAAGDRPSRVYFALMMTVFMNASPMLSDVASPRSATAMCTMRRS